MTKPQPQNPIRHLITFSVMFIACLLGSAAIFIMAVGLETGNPIINNVMRLLIDNAIWVFGAFGIVNLMIWLIYQKQKGKV